MPMLASDLINPAFVGAKDPDSMLSVEFYWGLVKKMNRQPVLDENGKPKQVPYIRLSIPGNETYQFDGPVREDHKRRFARQWQYWQIQENQGENSDIPGWKLDDWEELSDEQRRELKYLRFSVVEQIAAASDMQVQRMGLNGQALRIKAREALQKRARESVNSEIKARDDKIKELSDDLSRLKAQVEQMIPPQKAKKSQEQS